MHLINQIRKLLFGLALACGLLSSCSAPTEKATNQSLQLTDDLGNKIIMPHAPHTVVSLSPAMTEMLFAVCADSQILAVTSICNYPEAVKNKKKISAYPLDIETIVGLKPDIIFTEEGMTSPENAEKLKSLGIPVYFQRYVTASDLLADLRMMGNLMQQPEKTTHVLDSLEAELRTFEAEAQMPKTRPKVLAITWQNPIYAYGKNTLMTDKIRLAGGENAIDTVFAKIYPELMREYILKMNPDVIFGGTFGKMDSTFFSLYPELKQVNAYRNKCVYELNDDLTSRPSPRVLESVREIKKVLASCPAAQPKQ
ncbi:iron complex transport system substrate-binding protein [Flexibacter flexilis DSM 6793]|uniref:Iron complex transport system substrate-binding protein n=1 Tax=Flexibacter flexilis DSM 6793 TaxID=927664 RepID=A0A1I1K3Z0_9BACT|nr:helical backbone metal receptor [Flexibacter flexilis]SFC55221.1 iron complex transport system substrate-binding protein [Flexibacter flexilis DSM 6793]